MPKNLIHKISTTTTCQGIKKILIAAVTLNSKIAKHSKHNADWTSKEDKIFFKTESEKAGVVIYGLNTYLAMGKPFPNRLNMVMAFNPEDYKDKEEENKIEFTNEAPEIILDKLEKRGYDSVVIGGGQSIYSLFLEKKLVDEIYLTIAPKLFGQGMGLFKDMDIDDVELELIEVKQLSENGEVSVKYKVINSIPIYKCNPNLRILK